MPFGDGVDGGGGRGATERKTTPRPRSAMPAPVLVVEDDEDGREIMRLLLEDAGYTMLEAEGGDAALELLREPAPARMVVVLDLLMRHGTGFELLAAVAQEPALAERHAYIVCSAHKREPEDIGPHFAALLQQLGVPFIAKPYDIEVMLATVAEASRRLDVAARPWTASDTA